MILLLSKKLQYGKRDAISSTNWIQQLSFKTGGLHRAIYLASLQALRVKSDLLMS